MQRALTLHQTTIGKKLVMALSGLVIVGFVIGHFLGNLNLYRGQEALDAYAHFLQGLTPVLWGTRLLLLLAFGVHITAAFSLWSRNNKARGSRYKKHQDMATDYAARTMYWSGPILLLFVVYHLLHFTILPAHPGEVYRNVVEGFQNPWIAGVYIVGNIALGFHLFHGIFSATQTLGANHPRFNSYRRDAAVAISAAITLGNLSFPISVLAGFVTV
ncbi:MAG: succinate dehydrogenase cytochrome b subunit [Deltaproteobacteria bacterium]|nr:succinate dehydrogenase cytochrome b subunit [Deltaproteobacteria bacterium]NND28634.1 succinate dehydrogenase cytochrome b subunit [Myxococcales bacterium]MBT8463190.1 succinate dehydrogenase cytochrome b subunit [Deltaproteobacteria bacterium]MBT8481328.1 succinate dehydrogenase cytochrome b subunit [Deltaproteobacteria bacterium]NNK06946.1 succinate dehydrogenase cytochrome b subunit [Myxococcales bacterium]